MADFILHRKKSVVTYPPYQFPEKAFPIYGNGKFYNGFSIGDASNLSVVNKDGVLKFSRGATNASKETTVILGTLPKSNKTTIYIDIASPLSQNMTYYGFKIQDKTLSTSEAWTTPQITHTDIRHASKVQAGGVLGIYFKNNADLPAIPDLLAVQAIWAFG